MPDPFERPDDPDWMIRARQQPYPADFIRTSAQLRAMPVRQPVAAIRDERNVKPEPPAARPRKRR